MMVHLNPVRDWAPPPLSVSLLHSHNAGSCMNPMKERRCNVWALPRQHSMASLSFFGYGGSTSPSRLPTLLGVGMVKDKQELSCMKYRNERNGQAAKQGRGHIIPSSCYGKKGGGKEENKGIYGWQDNIVFI